MAKGVTVHFLGELNGLAEELLLKLVLNNERCSIDKQSHAWMTSRISTELEFVDFAPVVFNVSRVKSNDITLLFDFKSNGLVNNPLNRLKGTKIVITNSETTQFISNGDYKMINISDMIHYTDEYSLNNKLDWLYSCCLSGKPIESVVDEKYWWVSQQDVASCLHRLIGSPEIIPAFLNICGRRGWLISETFDQLKLLFERTIAGATGQFNPTSLEHKPVITQTLTKVNDVINSSRPDLSPLDDTLQAIDGQRWRPIVPLRTSLMHYLAMKDISHSV